ncbi:MAG: hypothetical protein ABFD75_11265 [Smithella sp.]
MSEAFKKIGSVLARIFGVGDISLMRILSALVVANVMIVWTIMSFKAGKIEDVPWGTVAVFSTAFLCKAVQRFAENDSAKKESIE